MLGGSTSSLAFIACIVSSTHVSFRIQYARTEVLLLGGGGGFGVTVGIDCVGEGVVGCVEVIVGVFAAGTGVEGMELGAFALAGGGGGVADVGGGVAGVNDDRGVNVVDGVEGIEGIVGIVGILGIVGIDTAKDDRGICVIEGEGCVGERPGPGKTGAGCGDGAVRGTRGVVVPPVGGAVGSFGGVEDPESFVRVGLGGAMLTGTGI